MLIALGSQLLFSSSTSIRKLVFRIPPFQLAKGFAYISTALECSSSSCRVLAERTLASKRSSNVEFASYSFLNRQQR